MFASNTSAANGAATYIEDVFSTNLYTGDDTNSRVITNGIDLAGKGGLVITAPRNPGNFWSVADTARGATNWIYTQSTGAQQTGTDRYGSFGSTGYTMGSSAANGYMNYGGYTYASWTFRKQPKFMTIATWTGNGAGSQVISHDLGSVPGFIIVKAYSGASASGGWWYCYHRSLGNTKAIALNDTGAATTLINFWRNTDPTSTQFTVGSVLNDTSTNFIAYVFAHNAGGFGLTGTDNVISCGSYTGNGSTSGPSITLGYEPQWILTKNATSSGWNWNMFDNMRGLPVGSGDLALQANLSNAESGALNWIDPTATGFNITSSNAQINESGSTIIYIAIRRGPMKTPTSGTSVFSPYLASSSRASGYKVTIGFPLDAQIIGTIGGNHPRMLSRLTGVNSIDDNTVKPYLETDNTNAETTSGISRNVNNTQFAIPQDYGLTAAIYWNFRRAPGFFDEVCYTGTGADITVNHNLTVTPELIIGKGRSVGGYNWLVYHKDIGSTGGYPNYLKLNDTTGTSSGASTIWGTPTSTTFSYGSNATLNTSGGTYVAYLFASCPGVSKCTAFTGTGTLQTINCGFTSGARFVFIKRTDSTGDWYVWDSSRGLSSSNDPYLLLNSTAAEVTSTNWVDTTSTGFQVTAASGNNVNINGASYIALAVA